MDDRTISLKAAIDALEKEKPTPFVDKDGNIDPFGAGRQNQWYRDGIAIMNLPSAQPECEDAVSREKIAVHIARTNAVQKMSMTDWNEILDAIEAVPLVTPKQPGWIYIEDELPKTIINRHTNDYQEYNCLCDFGDNGFDVRTYKFGNGHFWNGGGIVDKYVTAWQPLPEIPDTLRQKPLEGGQDDDS